jgi:hypothetical protein
MCQKHSTINFMDIRIDPCMEEKLIKLWKQGITTLACCCGHGRYPETIIIYASLFFPSSKEIYELNSSVKIPRTKRFYRRDSAGFYYIPEVSRPLQSEYCTERKVEE